MVRARRGAKVSGRKNIRMPSSKNQKNPSRLRLFSIVILRKGDKP
jgi:hypothetical protein